MSEKIRHYHFIVKTHLSLDEIWTNLQRAIGDDGKLLQLEEYQFKRSLISEE